jgi:fermentation-respiration switch protein FrsA (DUF1100 family)
LTFPPITLMKPDSSLTTRNRSFECPVFIIHGEADQLIPAWHGKRLFELAHDPKKYLSIPRAGHNDLDMVAGPAYSAFLAEFAAIVNKRQATAASTDPKP